MRVCPECQYKTDALACPKDGTPTIDETLLRDSPDPLIGCVLAGRYRVLEALGHGSMGRVYVADQMAMKRRVALKVIRAETLSGVADRLNLIRRFQREALAASRLKHPNIVQVYDHGSTEDGLLFLVMELLEGQTLAKVLQRQGRLPPEKAVPIAVQVCEALAEAHETGVVHRDLKPENVMLTRLAGGRHLVKVLDFGIAKMALPGTGDSAMTGSGIVLGTPFYMAPEQGLGQPVGPAADLYALGVILYEALSGRMPFVGDAPLVVMMQHAYEPPPPLVKDGRPSDVPPALEQLVMALLAKRPEDRPGPALQVRALLEASLGRGVRKDEGGEDDITVHWPSRKDEGPADAAATVLDELRRRRARKRVAWIVAGVAALAVGGLAGLHLGGGEGGRAGAGATADATVAGDGGPGSEDVVPPRDKGPVGEDTGAPDSGNRVGKAGVPGARVAPEPEWRAPRVVERHQEKRRKPLPLPPCKALRCPFTRECIGPDGRRTVGQDWCFPKF